MTNFTRANAKSAAFKAIAAINENTQYDSAITGQISMENDRLIFKIELKQPGAPSREEADLSWANQVGLTKWKKGDKLFAFGDRYKVIGWNRKAKKKPLIVESLKNQRIYVIHAQNPDTEYIPAVGRSEWVRILN